MNLKNFAMVAAQNIGSYLWKTTQIYTIISALRIAIFFEKTMPVYAGNGEKHTLKKEYDNLTFVEAKYD